MYLYVYVYDIHIYAYICVCICMHMCMIVEYIVNSGQVKLYGMTLCIVYSYLNFDTYKYYYMYIYINLV